MDTLYTLGLHEAFTLLKQGEITSLALTESVLGRIEAVEPRVKAYLVINAEKARDQAIHCLFRVIRHSSESWNPS
mgnify:CR=1 FL=1